MYGEGGDPAAGGQREHADYGRAANALEAGKQIAETAGDDLEFIFDRAGVQWVPELEDPDSEYHELFEPIREDASVCDYCASAFDVSEAVDDAGLARLAEYDGHPSVRSLVADDYEIVTF